MALHVAGIDLSTFAVDIVRLSFDHDKPEWDHFAFEGKTALDRAIDACHTLPRGSYWDDTALVAIERPYGPGRDIIFHLHLIVGAVVAALPVRLKPWFMHPSEWRKACDLPGNATKNEVAEFTISRDFSLHGPALTISREWPQDACDAYCLALGARTINIRDTLASEKDMSTVIGPCILWQGRLSPAGYGLVSNRAGSQLAHRVAYVAACGPIDPSLQVHHRCEVPACVNPDHLVAVTAYEHRSYHGCELKDAVA